MSTDNIEEEVMALVQGLQLAKWYNLVLLEINVDCKDILCLISNNHTKYWNIISNCKDLLQHLGSPQLSIFIKKATTLQMYSLKGAKEEACMYIINPITILEVPPLFIRAKIDADKNGTLFVRLASSLAYESKP